MRKTYEVRWTEEFSIKGKYHKRENLLTYANKEAADACANGLENDKRVSNIRIT